MQSGWGASQPCLPPLPGLNPDPPPPELPQTSRGAPPPATGHTRSLEKRRVVPCNPRQRAGGAYQPHPQPPGAPAWAPADPRPSAAEPGAPAAGSNRGPGAGGVRGLGALPAQAQRAPLSRRRCGEAASPGAAGSTARRESGVWGGGCGEWGGRCGGHRGSAVEALPVG